MSFLPLDSETSVKPEDSLCPMIISSLPDTLLMNELFPAPVIPITAITISEEFELILADYPLGEMTTLGLVATPNDDLASSPRNFAIEVYSSSRREFQRLRLAFTRPLVRKAPMGIVGCKLGRNNELLRLFQGSSIISQPCKAFVSVLS